MGGEGKAAGVCVCVCVCARARAGCRRVRAPCGGGEGSAPRLGAFPFNYC